MTNSSWLGFLVIGVAIALVVMAWPVCADEIAQKQGAAQSWVTPAVNVPGLEQRTFFSTSADSMVSYHVYTPDLYGTDKERRFPVIYWLHGHEGGGARQLPPLVEYFDQAMREGNLPPALIVFPNGMTESMWVDSKDGRVPMETVVIRELIPNVDAAYRTITSRSGRLIEGFSMGGYGAARLGFKYPEVFGSVSMFGAGPMQREFISGAGGGKMASDRSRILQNVYGNDQAYFFAQSPWVLAERYADATRHKIRVRIAVGSRDAMLGPNRDFAAHLSRLRIPYDFQEVPNVGHAPFPLFRGLGEANWDFYRAALGREGASDALRVAVPAKTDSTLAERPSWIPGNDRRRPPVERLRRFDHDGDGVVNLKDLPPQARARFQRFDTNSNGRLDVDELSDLR